MNYAAFFLFLWPPLYGIGITFVWCDFWPWFVLRYQLSPAWLYWGFILRLTYNQRDSGLWTFSSTLHNGSPQLSSAGGSRIHTLGTHDSCYCVVVNSLKTPVRTSLFNLVTDGDVMSCGAWNLVPWNVPRWCTSLFFDFHFEFVSVELDLWFRSTDPTVSSENTF